MPMIYITSEKDRSMHPQAKRIVPYIFQQFFRNQLSEEEVDMIETGDIQKSSISQLSIERKIRLFICFLLSNNPQHGPQEIIDIAEKVFMLPPSEIIRCALLTGHQEIVLLQQHQLSESELKNIMTSDDVLSSLSQKTLHFILNFSLLSGLSIKSCLTNRHYTTMYISACQNDHMEVIQHVETIAGFDRKAAASADNHAAFRYALLNGHIEVVKHLEIIDEGLPKKMYSAISRACCANSYMAVIAHLEEAMAREDFDKMKEPSANDPNTASSKTGNATYSGTFFGSGTGDRSNEDPDMGPTVK